MTAEYVAEVVNRRRSFHNVTAVADGDVVRLSSLKGRKSVALPLLPDVKTAETVAFPRVLKAAVKSLALPDFR